MLLRQKLFAPVAALLLLLTACGEPGPDTPVMALGKEVSTGPRRA